MHAGHSPYFMFDEDVLPTGAVHAAIAERSLVVAMSLSSGGPLTRSNIQFRYQWPRIINPCIDADAKKGHA